MTFGLFVVAWLLLPLMGLVTWRLDAVRRLDLAGRIAIAFAAGALTMGVLMFLMSIVGLRWSRATLLIPMAVIAAIEIRRIVSISPTEARQSARIRLTDAAIVLLVVLTVYGALNARESSGDLHYFWGPKAVRFYRAGGIDTEFLRNRDFYSMHPDYPPLVPLLYAWANALSHRFSWFGAVATAALLLFLTVAAVRSLTRDHLGALLIAATLAQAMAIGYTAGSADPLLIFFEAIALCALVFIDDPRSQIVLAALGVAGAAWTKIEGTTFAIAVVIAILIATRRWRRAVVVVAPAVVLVAAWTIFIAAAGVLDMYAAAGRYPIYLHSLPKTLALLGSTASYNVAWLPWIAPMVLIAIGDVRRAVLPIAVCVLTILAAIYFYLHAEDATWWIASSAHRVLLTPLLALDIAAIAASTAGRTSFDSSPVVASS